MSTTALVRVSRATHSTPGFLRCRCGGGRVLPGRSVPSSKADLPVQTRTGGGRPVAARAGGGSGRARARDGGPNPVFRGRLDTQAGPDAARYIAPRGPPLFDRSNPIGRRGSGGAADSPFLRWRRRAAGKGRAGLTAHRCGAAGVRPPPTWSPPVPLTPPPASHLASGRESGCYCTWFHSWHRSFSLQHIGVLCLQDKY